ncbi:MAG: B12-binding domain-containing radical SAM protein, partial [Bryobacterales bacterium]|nr:B12-binding domain-containing radical SAM protein [Bryobacterales bacterium]
MIVFLHPRSIRRARNRRFPLSVLALAAVLEGREEYEIVDGNIDPDPAASLGRVMRERPARALCVSLMPGPQMVAAIGLSRWFRASYPHVPIIWGGYFPSLYPDTALNAPYVDVVVRGQGEDTFLELLASVGQASACGGFQPSALRHIPGISYRDQFGLHVHTRDRGIRSPGDFPWMPYHSLREPHKYLARTFLGNRTAVHQASYGCPFRCKFCGVTEVAGGRQKCEKPERTAAILTKLQHDFGIDAVQFYDNNFFLREDDSAELAERIGPLNLQWWCEGRIDILLRYSDRTLAALRRSGCKMIFLGAESGSDEILRAMDKQLTSSQTLDLARRIRQFGIIPEFSFVIGNPKDPDTDLRTNMQFIRKLKSANPDAEIIIQHYTPTPHPDGMYGDIDDKIAFPKTPDEWATPRWYNFTVREDPALPWLPRRTKRLIDAFETVMSCRWPTIQDSRLSRWARAMLK